MFGDVAPKNELPVDGGHYLCAKVDFSGYRSGTLGISTTVDLCIQLAVNVLGMELDSDDSADYAPDTLRELVNIMCGRFLTELFGEERIFDLSPPSSSEIDRAKWMELIDDEETIGYMIEEFPAIIYVSLDRR